MNIKKRLLVGGVCGALLIGTMVPALAATVHYNDGAAVGGSAEWTAWTQEWNTVATDYTQVSLTPGADETELNFAWYSKDNGKLLTDTTVEPVEHQQRVRMSKYGSGYVWLKLQDNDRYETTATRLYGPQGLVSDLTALQGKYSYVNYLTTDPDGRPMFYGSRAAAGSAYGSVCDVLNADGKVVLQGLSSCTGYYSNSLNALPDHVFAAQRGFYVGWMDTSGNWLYCQSIFSSATADDVPSYGY